MRILGTTFMFAVLLIVAAPAIAQNQPRGQPAPPPAKPSFDGKACNDLMQANRTDVSEWGYPVSADVEVRAAPQANAPVIDKLALAFVRVMPEGGPNVPTFLRVVTPGGKTGFVSVD